jgi:hypothetical protein
MPVYILDMLDLSAEIKSAFEKGEFFIRQTSVPVEIFMRQGGWASISKESVMVYYCLNLFLHLSSGEKKCRKFVNSALSVGQSVSFYSPISKSKLKTFEHMNAKTSLKCKSGEIITGHTYQRGQS